MDLLISKECGNHAFRMVLPWPYVAFLSLLPLHCYQSHTLLPLILLPPVSWEHTFLRLLLLLLLFMSIAVKVRLLAMNSGTFKIGTECLLESNHKVLSTTALIIEWFFVNITCHSSYPCYYHCCSWEKDSLLVLAHHILAGQLLIVSIPAGQTWLQWSLKLASLMLLGQSHAAVLLLHFTDSMVYLTSHPRWYRRR